VSSIAVDPERLLRLSLDEYHRLIEAGGLDEDARVELIDGLLVALSPKTPAHERALTWLLAWLFAHVDQRRYMVRAGSPLTLAGSEPEPDLSVVERGTPEPYHPATAALVVEISHSSLGHDLGAKAALYATANVTELWVVDLDGGRVLVHRHPRGDGWDEQEVASADGRVVGGDALGLPALAVSQLLQAAAG
jgi:Uma2 family endonuclease